ncbi:MAG: aminotransferase class I/II-fold pyridoxal phosphate-dependent enzyme [Campylobacterota bacterium]|nr:aminotransferase class I/II-fold pyridoxal phosphate-dependent enzyme [Campylobacterota bacterium]
MKHGAGIYKVAKKLGCTPDEIVDFSSNINLYQPKINIKIDAKKLARYPDSDYSELKKVIAKKLALKKSQIALYKGATAAIFELIGSLKPQDIYLYAPLYGEYKEAAQKANKKIHILSRLYEIETKVKRGSIVVFVNPTTPDAKHYDLGRLFELWRERECTIIIDESFIEFEGLDSSMSELSNNKKLYFIKSFTKFYACAGVRVGAVVSSKKNIQKLPTHLWGLSSFDSEFLKQRLQDRAFAKKSRELHIRQKRELLNILEESKLFDFIIPSDANFILVHSPNAKRIFKRLLSHKILVRTAGSFDFLSNDCLRFAVKDRESHKLLKKALYE